MRERTNNHCYEAFFPRGELSPFEVVWTAFVKFTWWRTAKEDSRGMSVKRSWFEWQIGSLSNPASSDISVTCLADFSPRSCVSEIRLSFRTIELRENERVRQSRARVKEKGRKRFQKHPPSCLSLSLSFFSLFNSRLVLFQSPFLSLPLSSSLGFSHFSLIGSVSVVNRKKEPPIRKTCSFSRFPLVR